MPADRPDDDVLQRRLPLPLAQLHRHAREVRGVRSFIPATAGRPTTKPPTGRYRRRMKQRLNKHYGGYG